MKTSSKSRRLNTYLAAGVGVSATLSTQAEAAIVYFDVNPDQTFGITNTLNFGAINLGTGTYALNDTSGTSFGLDFSGYLGALAGYLNPLGNVQWGFTGSYVERSALNDNINEASATNWGTIPSAYLFGSYTGANGNWSFGPNETNSGFAPLRIDAGDGNYNYGWVEVSVVSGNTNSPPYLGTVNVTVTSFAFNTNFNEAIQAGAVPEPSTVACLLLGGSAFAFSRRRRPAGQKMAS